MAETTVTPTNPYEFIQLAPIAARVRVTLVSGQPVMTSTVLAATQVIITPYQGGIFPAYRPTVGLWRAVPFSEFVIPLALGTGNQQVTTNSNYDILGDLDLVSGQAKFYLSPAWASDTSLGTNPGSAERTTVAGIALNRWNVPGGPDALRGTVLGSIRTGTSAAVDWNYGGFGSSTTPAVLGVFNMFNRKKVTGSIGDTTASWTWTSTAWRAANGASTTARVSALLGVAEEPCTVVYAARGSCANVAGGPVAGVGVDSVSAPSTSSIIQLGAAGVAGNAGPATGGYSGQQFGFHFFEALEASLAVGTTTTFNGFTAAFSSQTGISYEFWM